MLDNEEVGIVVALHTKDTVYQKTESWKKVKSATQQPAGSEKEQCRAAWPVKRILFGEDRPGISEESLTKSLKFPKKFGKELFYSFFSVPLSRLTLYPEVKIPLKIP